MKHKENNIFKEENEIDLIELFFVLKKNKTLVFLITFIFGLVGFGSSYFKQPTWKGEFQIVMEDKNKNNSISSSGLSGGLISLNKGLFGNSFGSRAIETEIGILESPLILKPTFNFVKQYKSVKGEDWSGMTFNEWKNGLLEIKLLNDTSILSISYTDKDKDLIIKTLEMISEQYQQYSKRDRIRGLNNAINYLSNSYDKAAKKSKNSTEKLQNFALKHKLGNYDGLPLSSDLSNKGANLEKKNNKYFETPYNTTGRYNSHFLKLQALESEYDRLSALLLPNSKILEEIQIQIDYLNSKLERPNEIIVQFRELLRNASNDEVVLQNIDVELTALNLEKARQSTPWELISEPEIGTKPIDLSWKRSTAYALFIGLVISFIVISIKDIIVLQRIYTRGKFIDLIPYPLLKSISLKDNNDQEETIKILCKNFFPKENKSPLGIFVISEKMLDNIDLFIDKFKSFSKREIIATNNLMSLDSCSEVLLITYSDSVSVKNIKSIFEKINISNLNIIGWLFLDF